MSSVLYITHSIDAGRMGLKCDDTRAETRFRLSAKRLSPFKSAGASVLSTTGRRAVHISLQGLYCSCKPVFCSHVTLTGYPLHSLVSSSLLLPCVSVCHHISNAFYVVDATYRQLYTRERDADPTVQEAWRAPERIPKISPLTAFDPQTV